jgi:hypothetical protein
MTTIYAVLIAAFQIDGSNVYRIVILGSAILVASPPTFRQVVWANFVNR